MDRQDEVLQADMDHGRVQHRKSLKMDLDTARAHGMEVEGEVRQSNFPTVH